MKKNSKNPQKTLFSGHFEPVLPKFGQKWIFLEKRAQFLNIPIIYYCAKSQKKLMTHLLEKCQTEKERWFYRTFRRMGDQKYKIIAS